MYVFKNDFRYRVCIYLLLTQDLQDLFARIHVTLPRFNFLFSVVITINKWNWDGYNIIPGIS